MENSERNEGIREKLVVTAVSFLLNPKVRNSALQQKKQFLRTKGLTEEEIEAAIERSLQIDVLSPTHSNSNHNASTQIVPSFWMRTLSNVPAAAVVALVLYGSYIFYKKYLEPLFFAHSKRQHPFLVIEQKLTEIENTMELLKLNIAQVEINLRKEIKREVATISGPNPVEVAAINELKSELSSIKALLLSRKQFPTTPIPSIPAWQLNGESETDKTDNLITNDSSSFIQTKVAENTESVTNGEKVEESIEQ